MNLPVEWPERSAYCDEFKNGAPAQQAMASMYYERAMKEAAMERLRIVSPAKLRNCAASLRAGMTPLLVAYELELYAELIGELPPLPELPAMGDAK